jgi:hypothetical protein
MRFDKIILEDDHEMVLNDWIMATTNVSESTKNHIEKSLKQGWCDFNDTIIPKILESIFYKRKRQHPKGLSVFRVAPSELTTYQKWLDVPNWLQEKDIEILERGILERCLDEEDGITLRVLDWAWKEEVHWEDAPYKKRTHTIINTLVEDELITDYIRNLYWWTMEGKKSERITQIKIGDLINLNDREEIEQFRQKLCFIRDYQVYNAKWKEILNVFDMWFRQEYFNRRGHEYQTQRSEHKNLSEMFGDKLYIQQKGWGNLEELKRECW